MTLELVPWRGSRVPLLDVQRSLSLDQMAQMVAAAQGYMGPPPLPSTTYGMRPAEPISASFEGFAYGMLYQDGPVAAVEAYRLAVFGQAPLLYQEITDGRPGKLVDDESLDLLRAPWPGGTLSDLLKRSLMYGDFGGNAFPVYVDGELVLLRPDWVEIVLEKRMHRGMQVGWRQVGIMYYEGGLGVGDGVPFLPGEYAHYVPGLPDPLATYRGMSWLTPLVREVKADKSAGDHKVAWFENSASVNVAVSLPKEITAEQFAAFVERMDSQHRGAQNAGKTLYTGGGADVTVIGANMQQADFASIVGKGENRIANAGRVPAVLLGFSEGLGGSSLNAGNYTAAKRNFVDTTMRDLWMNFCGSLAQMDAFKPPKKTRLWYDARDIPFLHEDAKDLADIQAVQASAINTHVTAGWKPESARDAIVHDDPSLLEPSGFVSVQLAPPGQGGSAGSASYTDPNPIPDTGGGAADPNAAVQDQARAITALADLITRSNDVERAFNPHQLRGPDGKWVRGAGAAIRHLEQSLGRVFSRVEVQGVDRGGVHFLIHVKKLAVPVTVSWLDVAELGLLLVPGAGEVEAGADVAKTALIVNRVRKAVKAAHAAEAVAGAVGHGRRRHRVGMPHVERRFNPDQPRIPAGADGGGRWGAVGGLVDKLKLADRIGLAAGETFQGSAKLSLSEDGADIPMAWTHRADGSHLRLGVGVNSDDVDRWTGADLGATVDLDERGQRELRHGLESMRQAGLRAQSRWNDLHDQMDELQARQRVLVHQQFPHHTRAQAKELDRLDAGLPQWRQELDGRLSREARSVEFYQHNPPGSGGPQHMRDANLARIAALRREIADGERRRAELTGDPAPLLPADVAELGRVNAELSSVDTELDRMAEGITVGAGSVHAGWGSLRWQGDTNDSGEVGYTLTVVPARPPTVQFDPDVHVTGKDLDKLLALLAEGDAITTRAVLDALGDVIERRFNPDQARIEKGHQGGGRFGSKVTDLLEAFIASGGHGDPFGEARVTRPTIVKVAEAHGVFVPPRMPLAALKSATYAAVLEQANAPRPAPLSPEAERVRRIADAAPLSELAHDIDLASTRKEPERSRVIGEHLAGAEQAGALTSLQADKLRSTLDGEGGASKVKAAVGRLNKANGVTLIGSAEKTATFDPAQHRPLVHDTAADSIEPGTRVRVVAQGWALDGETVEPARVAPVGRPAAKKTAPAVSPKTGTVEHVASVLGALDAELRKVPQGRRKSGLGGRSPADVAKYYHERVLSGELPPDQVGGLLQRLLFQQSDAGGPVDPVAVKVFEQAGGHHEGKDPRLAAAIQQAIAGLKGDTTPAASVGRPARKAPAKKVAPAAVDRSPDGLVAAVTAGRISRQDAIAEIKDGLTVQSGALSGRGFNVNDPGWQRDGTVERQTRAIYADYERGKAALGQLGSEWTGEEPWHLPLAEHRQVRQRHPDLGPEVTSAEPVQPDMVPRIMDFQLRHGSMMATANAVPTPDASGKVTVEGRFLHGRDTVGTFRYMYDPTSMTVHADAIGMKPEQRGSGFGRAFAEQVEGEARARGYRRMTVSAAYGGGAFWAQQGFGWDPEQAGAYGDVPARMLAELTRDPSAEDEQQLRAWLERFRGDERGWPTPQDLVATPLGTRILSGASWQGSKDLAPAFPVGKAPAKAAKKAVDPGMAQERAARDRVAEAQRLTAVGTAVSEIHELVDNGSSPAALRQRITARQGTAGVDTQAFLDRVNDPQALLAEADRQARAAGVERLNAPGDIVPMDPKLHQSIGGHIPAGTLVRVARPGHTATLGDGTRVGASPTLVEAATPEEIAAYKAAQAPKKATKAAKKAAKATPGAPSLTPAKATPNPNDPARQLEVENRIRAAYTAVLARRGRTARPGDTQWVGLADLRTELGDLDRQQVDAGLRRLEQADGVNIVPESNQKTLTEADRAAAVTIGDQQKHAISIAAMPPVKGADLTPAKGVKVPAGHKAFTRPDGVIEVRAGSGSPVLQVEQIVDGSGRKRWAAYPPGDATPTAGFSSRQMAVDHGMAELARKQKASAPPAPGRYGWGDNPPSTPEPTDAYLVAHEMDTRRTDAQDGRYNPPVPSLYPTPDSTVARDILAAYQRAVAASPENHSGSPDALVYLADLRDQLGATYPYAQVQQVLAKLHRQVSTVSLEPEVDRGSLTQRQTDGRINMGGEARETISVLNAEELLAQSDPIVRDEPGTAVRSSALTDPIDDPSLDEIRSMAADDAIRAAGHDVTPGHDQLHHYWLTKGLPKWADSPKPWTTLVALLTPHVGLEKAKIFASRWFIEHFGFAAGSDLNRVTHGHPPRGHRVGPG